MKTGHNKYNVFVFGCEKEHFNCLVIECYPSICRDFFLSDYHRMKIAVLPLRFWPTILTIKLLCLNCIGFGFHVLNVFVFWRDLYFIDDLIPDEIGGDETVMMAAQSLLVLVSTPPMGDKYQEFQDKVREYNAEEPFKFKASEIFDEGYVAVCMMSISTCIFLNIKLANFACKWPELGFL